MKALVQSILDKKPLADRDYFYSQDYNGIEMTLPVEGEEESNRISKTLKEDDEYLVNVGTQGFVVTIRVSDIKPVEIINVLGAKMYCHRFWAEYVLSQT